MKKIVYDFTNKEKELLNGLKNDYILSYSFGEEEHHKELVMGNFLLKTQTKFIEISNYEKTSQWFNGNEEVSNLRIKEIKNESEYTPYTNKENCKTIVIDKKITKIELIYDIITIQPNDYEFTILRGIIFNFENDERFIVSIGWYFGEMIYISQVEEEMYSIDRIIDDWKMDYDDRKVILKRIKKEI